MAYAVVDGLKVRLDDVWLEWIERQFAKGYSPQEVAVSMARSTMTVPEIRAYMGERFPEDTELSTPEAMAWRRPVDVVDVDYKKLCEIAITRSDSPKVRRHPDERVQLYIIDDLLSAEECEATLAAMRGKLKRSVTTGDDEKDPYFRTSQTSFLWESDGALALSLDVKIAQALGIHPAFAEQIQAQLYGVGEEFRPHKDAFDPWAEKYKHFGGARGNRTWTCMIYLQDTPKGGATHFTEIDARFYPKRGMALAWNNLYANGWLNFDTKHWGMPVEEGEKAIITKWFRERPTLSMFWG